MNFVKLCPQIANGLYVARLLRRGSVTRKNGLMGPFLEFILLGYSPMITARLWGPPFQDDNLIVNSREFQTIEMLLGRIINPDFDPFERIIEEVQKVPAIIQIEAVCRDGKYFHNVIGVWRYQDTIGQWQSQVVNYSVAAEILNSEVSFE